MYSGNPNIRTLPVSATWVQNRPQEPPPESPAPAHSRPAPAVGKRTELARYRTPADERVLYGQRVNGVVRFLPDQPVVLDAPTASSEDSKCCCRKSLEREERPGAARQKRPNDEDGQSATTEPQPERRGCTGARVELARYVVSAGERQLFGQRIFGAVQITDVPVAAAGHSYVSDRGEQFALRK
jgi:hypothetical protein